MAEQTQATMVGETILITGNLRGDEDLTVLGRVEGHIHLSKTLLVAERGIVKAEIDVKNVVVSGIVVGNISASDCIHITQSGRVLGDVRARRIILDAGARVRGDIDVGAQAASSSQEERSSSAATLALAAAPQAQPQQQRRNLGPATGSAPISRATNLGQSSPPVSFQTAGQAAMALATKKKVVVKKHS